MMSTQGAWEELHTPLNHCLLTGARRQPGNRTVTSPWWRGFSSVTPRQNKNALLFFVVKTNWSHIPLPDLSLEQHCYKPSLNYGRTPVLAAKADKLCHIVLGHDSKTDRQWKHLFLIPRCITYCICSSTGLIILFFR